MSIPHTKEAFQLMMQGSEALANMSSAGMRIDTEYLDRKIVEIGNRIKEKQQELEATEFYGLWRKRFGANANLGSRPQMGDIIYKDLGFECKHFSDTGKPRVDVDALADIDHPFVNDYVRWQKLNKLHSTYLLGIRNEVDLRGFLHPSYNLHTVATTRSSCDLPNIQNIPIRDKDIASEIRPAFIPRNGHRLVEIDFSGAEVRCACAYHHDPVMIKYVLEDYDIHKDMAGECYLCPDSLISGDMRGTAKGMFVFASYYGDWYVQISQNLWKAVDRYDLKLKDGTSLREHLNQKGMTTLEAFTNHIKVVCDRFWFERFKVYSQWKEEWWNEYLKRGWFQMKTGFVCQGAYRRNQVINFAVQGSAFHWNLWVLIQLNKWLKKWKMRTRLIGQIHDSMVLDVYEGELQDVLAKVRQLITVDLPNFWKWINVPVNAEFSVCDTNWHTKKKWKVENGIWRVAN